MDKKVLIGLGATAFAVLVALWAANNVAPVKAIVAPKA